jgi:Tfp pilus assembly protein PilE
MGSHRIGGLLCAGRRRDRVTRRVRSDDGFTLVELLLTSLILPIVIGAIVLALTSLLLFQGSVANRTSDASDAQAVASFYEQDVQSALYITTSSSATQCGTGTQLLGLEWAPNPQTGIYQSIVSYTETTNATSHSLVRQYCASGASSTPTSSFVISSDIPASQSPPAVTYATGYSGSPSTGWATANGVTGVTFAVTEPASHYSYTLDAVPRSDISSSDLSSVSNPNASCGFASPNTGTYANTLCFIDFSSYNYQATPTGCGGNSKATSVAAAITDTPYVLTFCLVQTGSHSGDNGPYSGWAIPAAIPTYSNPPTSEAFLGNNGFYTNIPGKPALYQYEEGSVTTVTLTNIKLLDANGNSATGWYLTTGDAESTDSNEEMQWTSNQPLSLLNNTPSSPIGNACDNPSGTPDPDLTGVGTDQVTCTGHVDSDKTGTVMLQASAPTSLTVYMVGTGLEALFIGVLLS